MPIYEYECRKCEDVFEILQGFDDKPPKCERCGRKLKKLISLSAFHLKGSGWYETDYGKKKISEPEQLKDHGSDETTSDTAASSGKDSQATTPEPSAPSSSDSSSAVYDSIKSDTTKAKGKAKTTEK